MRAKKIFISNRTQSKAENLKKNFNEIEIISWGTIPDFDMIINATSLGLKNDENIILEILKKIGIDAKNNIHIFNIDLKNIVQYLLFDFFPFKISLNSGDLNFSLFLNKLNAL